MRKIDEATRWGSSSNWQGIKPFSTLGLAPSFWQGDFVACNFNYFESNKNTNYKVILVLDGPYAVQQAFVFVCRPVPELHFEVLI